MTVRMTVRRIMMFCLVVAGVCQGAMPHHLRHHSGELMKGADDVGSLKDRRSLQPDRIPYSYKKLDKMMKKAILQIILGDLHPADMLLLKALNYTLEEVMAIREHELSRLKEEEAMEVRAKKQQEQEMLSAKYQVAMRRRSSGSHQRKDSRENVFDAYNRQAVYDYENAPAVPAASKVDYEDGDKAGAEAEFRQNFDRVMEPHVVFKIRYDDSEFDSGSDEKSKMILKNHRTKTILKKSNAAVDSFQGSGSTPHFASAPPTDSVTKSNIEDFNQQAIADYENLVPTGTEDDELVKREFSSHEDFEKALNASNLEAEQQNQGNESSTDEKKRVSEYEGLEWLGDDVYRVVPEAVDALFNYEDVPAQDDDADDEAIRQTSYSSVDDVVNDTLEYQSDYAENFAGNDTDNQNLTSYQRFALAQRRDQGQKAIEDIKLKVLAMTGRFNFTSNHNQVQRERLTMFSPTCQIPRNTDAEAWSDPFLMNMHFSLNLTNGEHVLAAKLRLYKLPQESVSTPSSSSSTSTYEEDEEDEKKIRVSVYFYTKSLKKHRAKKRLMDSLVISLSSQGNHLALDVRQALRFWRPNAQQHNNNNHGLVVQVEDQDGRALKPSLYIQEPSCQTATASSGTNEKAYQYVPALFVRACTRYVRFVNGEPEVYVHCRQRH